MNLQYLLNKYKINLDIKMILDMWNESHRHFHNLDHLTDIIDQINESYGNNQIDVKEYEKLKLTALFHDIIYDPMRSDNEEKSAKFFLSCCSDRDNPHIKQIAEAILDTKTHKSTSVLSEKFNKFDMNIVERDFGQLLKWEDGIYEEYKFHGNDLYKQGRLQFLEGLLDQYPQNTENLLKLIEFVNDNY